MSARDFDAWVQKTFGVDPKQFAQTSATAAGQHRLDQFENRFKAFRALAAKVTAAQTHDDPNANKLRDRVADSYSRINRNVKSGDIQTAQRELDAATDQANEFVNYMAEHGGVSFGEAFARCMKVMNMPCPNGLFETAAKTLEIAAGLAANVEKFGTAVTVADIAVAGTVPEALLAVGGVLASAYAGVCIGCIATATGDVISGA